MSQSRHERHSSERKRKQNADPEDHHRQHHHRGSSSETGNDSRWDEKRTHQRNAENKRPRDREDEFRRPRQQRADDDDAPPPHRRRDHHNHKRSRFESSIKQEEDESKYEWGKGRVKQEKVKVDKEKPNFQTSGKLTEDANTVNGVVIKYSEPPEARKPKRRWRLYPFKGDESLPVLYIHRQSAYLIGRDRKIADIPVDHPSCSKQHAALQYRLVTFKRENGSEGKRIRPYLIDLESANGTYVNNVKLEPKRYHELIERDVVKFGFSSREYVVLHEQSKDEDFDDDIYEN